MKILSSCPVCSSSKLHLAFEAPTTRGQDKKLWKVSGCDSCSHQFMNPQPSWDELEPYYANGYQAHGAREALDEEIIKEAERTGKLRHVPLPTGKRVLDVGCGGGSFLRLCRRFGATVHGVEPSESAAEVAREQGVPVFCGTVEQFAAETNDRFDLITSAHVVEHLPDPLSALSAMKKLLAPAGMIWISVPNGAYPLARALRGHWHSSDLPYHLMHFSPESLAIAGKRAGLALHAQTTESLPRAVEATLGQYLRFRWTIPRRLSRSAVRSISPWLAARSDRTNTGEAILAEFVAN